MAFLQSLKTFLELMAVSNGSVTVYGAPLAVRGRSIAFHWSLKTFFEARCNGQRPVRNVPRGFGSARNADHSSPKPVDTVSELDPPLPTADW